MREEKQFLMDEIQTKMVASPDFILTHYNKMNPNTASQFRMKLSQAGGDFEVVKRRILLKAAAAVGCTLEPKLLEGLHVGVVFAEHDPIQVAKAVFKFRQENEEVLEIIGGRFEGRLYSAKDVEYLSKLPAKPEMQAQLLGLFEAVQSQTLGVMEALITSVVYCLDNKSKS
jgi:large subunit ribosomal protein L10